MLVDCKPQYSNFEDWAKAHRKTFCKNTAILFNFLKIFLSMD